jgi:hypothetical protein
MGTLYMVFHSVLQFWPGSALAMPVPSTNALAVTAISIAMDLIGVEMAFIVCPLTN